MNAGLYTAAGAQVALRGVEVTGAVLGAYAKITVRQRYRHTGDGAVEAIYTFPLPADATLTGFAMTCGARRFEGVVKERDAAFRAYDDAVTAGHGAALLEQERANVFTANVGNLLPGEETLVEVEYVQRTAVDEASLRVMIPTLVAPRYIPGAPAGDRTAHGESAPTDRVPDADRISPPRADHVPYGLTLDLRFELGAPVDVTSPSHAITALRDEGCTHVRFAQHEVALDRDVVLTARGEAPGLAPIAGLSAHRGDDEKGYVALTVVPDLFSLGADAARTPTVVFVVDVSGSMEGDSIREARAAMRLCLRHLRDGDRFNILAFSTTYTAFAREPVAFSAATLARADRWCAALQADGGTELLDPMVAATAMAPDGVVVLLTDGQVGNEDEVLRAVLAKRGERRTRVCSFGIGTNVSDALLRELGRATGGAVEFIHPGERIDEKVVAQFARAVAPRITKVSLTAKGVALDELSPQRLPDLVDGEAWTLFARYDAPGEGTLELRGQYGETPFALTLPASLPARRDAPAVPKLWAAERIRELEQAVVTGRRADTMRARIVEIATAHNVSSRFTSFVVIEKREGARLAQGMPTTSVVPVNTPAGWAMYEGAATADDESVDDLAMPVGAARRGAPKGGAMKKSKKPAPAMAPRMFGAPSPKLAAPGAPPSVGGAMPPPMAAPSMAAPAPAPMRAREMAKASIATMDFMLEEREEEASFMAFADAAPEPVLAEESVRASRVDDLAAVFGAQLASGLWGDGRNEIDDLRATARVFARLVTEGITTAHRLYGTQVRKAIERVTAVLQARADVDPALATWTLAAARLLATGARTRSLVDGALTAHARALPDEARANDTALRAWLDAHPAP